MSNGVSEALIAVIEKEGKKDKLWHSANIGNWRVYK